ncbi:MAG: hypothetical protein H0U69_02930 [Trueperaceae bacterium]|nr:hypothetical protein [Trueperaceae bacterium]
MYPSHLRAVTWLRVGRKHAAPIDPLKNLWVDPATIETFLELRRDEFIRMRFVFDVIGGDWDLRAKPIEEHFMYHSFVARFKHGAAWEETRLYAVALEGIRNGTWHYHGARDASQVMQRLGDVDRLYERIGRVGYRRQAELADEAPGQPLSRRATRPPELDEVMVALDRDGAIAFVDGIHRLAVAKLVGVPCIPICVLIRHEAWQARRDRVAQDRTPRATELSVHPDLAGLRRG